MTKKSAAEEKIVELKNSASGESPVRRKGIYLLPNLLTTGALFAGFYAVLSGFSGKYELAAIAIFTAMVFDGLCAKLHGLALGVQLSRLASR